MRTLTILSSILCAISIMASPLTPEQSLSCIRTEGPEKLRGTYSQMSLVDTRTVNGTAALYLFADQNGFVVTSADDCVPVLLGYGENGSPLSVSDNPNFNYWLDFISGRIALAVESGYTPAPRNSDFDPMEPLCATMWNQNSPYNDLCPDYNGSKSVTGCVATGMAIMMKYHNWPDQGVGSLKYEWRNKPGQYLFTDFSEYTFDWDNMLDVYGNSANATQKTAVARLMRAAGGAVKMNYSSSASGAYSADIAPALANYFKYDKSLQYQMRDYYPLFEWEQMIYASLQATGPVIYCGASGSGGHCFICDGYSSNGLFHINWGWGGSSNGYFLLDVLDPASQGIGGSNAGYNSNQDVVLFAKPDRDGTSVPNPPMLWWEEGMDVSYDKTTSPGQSIDVNSGFWNFGPFILESGAAIQWRLTPLAGGEPITFGRYITPEDEALDIYYGWDSWQITVPEGLPEGSYKLWLEVAKAPDDEFIMIPTIITESPYLIADVDASGNLTLRKLWIPRMNIPDFSFPEEIKTENPVIDYSVTLENIGSDKLLSYARLQLYKDNEVCALTEYEQIVIGPNMTKTLEGNVPFEWLNGNTPVAGEYKIGMFGFNCNLKYDKNPALDNLTGWMPLTPLYDIKFTTESGIASPDADDESDALWYDLQGRRIMHPSAPGIYIRKSGEQVQKVIL